MKKRIAGALSGSSSSERMKGLWVGGTLPLGLNPPVGGADLREVEGKGAATRKSPVTSCGSQGASLGNQTFLETYVRQSRLSGII